MSVTLEGPLMPLFDGLDLFGAVVAAEIIESVIEDDFISTDTSFDTDS